MSTVIPYIEIARPDHWFKNVFMILGTVLAFFYTPQLGTQLDTLWWPFFLAVSATCIIASSNYVINEILDAPTDLSHPVKKNRPIPSGKVNISLAYLEWLLLAAVGLFMSWNVNSYFFYSALGLWIMGLIYNIPPIRSKELPYLDVLSESVNNPLRLLLGWFAVSTSSIPPLSLMLAYWMLGAFFMAAKRWAEFRSLADPEKAAAYRASFKYYNLERLMTSIMFYAVTSALFLGIFIVRYHVELILMTPFIAGFFAFYLHITFLENSPVQNPEKLYRQSGLMVYLVICCVLFFGLMFTDIPWLYDLFNVKPSKLNDLWPIQ